MAHDRLRVGSFALHFARGLIRNQTTRRWAMFVLMTTAMLLVFAGTTFLEGPLASREHLGAFVLYWLACAWVTLTALLLAIFDLLMVRAQSRGVRRALGSNADDE